MAQRQYRGKLCAEGLDSRYSTEVSQDAEAVGAWCMLSEGKSGASLVGRGDISSIALSDRPICMQSLRIVLLTMGRTRTFVRVGGSTACSGSRVDGELKLV